MSGAVTALGDTLFPAGSLAEGLRQDLSPTPHTAGPAARLAPRDRGRTGL